MSGCLRKMCRLSLLISWGIENGQGVHARRARLWWRRVTSTMSTCTFGKISPPHRDHM